LTVNMSAAVDWDAPAAAITAPSVIAPNLTLIGTPCVQINPVMKPTQGPDAVKGNYYARFRRCFHQAASWELSPTICLCKSSAPKLPIAVIDLFNESNDFHGGPRTRSIAD
jgi:hypothetical protein